MDPTQPDIIGLSQKLAGMAQTALNEPEVGTVAAVGPDTRQTQQNPLVTLPFTEDFIKEMWDKVDKGTAMIAHKKEEWEILLKAYIPNVKASGEPETVKTGTHFRNLHTKIAHLFLQTPEIRVSERPVSPTDMRQPSPMGPMAPPLKLEDILMVKQVALNDLLGRDGIKVDRLHDSLLFDAIGWAGIGCSKLGHRAVTRQVQQPIMGPDPNWQPPVSTNPLMPAPPATPPMVPQVDPLTQQPLTETIDVPIFEENYWRRFSPLKYIPDPTCTSTMIDQDAGFQGMWWSMYPHEAKAAFGLTDEEVGKTGEDDKVFKHAEQAERPKVVMGVELFIRASAIDPAILTPEGQQPQAAHPKQLLQMVLLKDVKDKPVVWRPCLDQSFTPTGDLTDNSLDGFPIRVLTLRDLADSCLPGSDASFTNAIIKTRDTNRRQSIALRDAAIPKILISGGALEDNDRAAIENGKPGQIIILTDGALAQGADKVMASTPVPKLSPDFYQLDIALKQDNDEMLGLGANAAGNTTDTVRSATETAVTNQGMVNREEKERARVIDHLLDGVRLLDILLCRYTTQQQWVRYVGPDGAQVMQAWNGAQLSGRWLYDIAPDSQFRVDTAVDRQQNLAFYNLTAKDPLVNRVPILRRLARQFGYDPNKVIADPVLMAMQPQHGGVVNAHQASNSGGQPNQPGAQNQREDQQQQQNPGSEQQQQSGQPAMQPCPSQLWRPSFYWGLS